ncbi:MAG TPA: hypothetical protein PKX21_02265, partial [Candidatus Pacearchaeota archaeon]|nr:hypothetical protein [Candidatus Pacearchaeota archaeon]
TLRAPSYHEGGEFSYWSGCDSTSQRDCTVTVSGGSSRTITAHYTKTVVPVTGLTINKYVRNVSRGDQVWSTTTNAIPSDLISFGLTVSNQGSDTLYQVEVKDSLPAHLSFMSGSVIIDKVPTNYDIRQGINLGNLVPGQTKNITFRATIAGSSSFSYGTVSVVNTAYAESDSQSVSDSATTWVTRSDILGAADVPTGFGGTITRYLILPLLISLLVLVAFRHQWVLIGRWLEKRRREARAYRSEKALYRSANQAKQLS